jgi:hypothetical protein
MDLIIEIYLYCSNIWLSWGTFQFKKCNGSYHDEVFVVRHCPMGWNKSLQLWFIPWTKYGHFLDAYFLSVLLMVRKIQS